MKILTILLSLLVSTLVHSQNNKLYGNWILDKSTFLDGNPIEINDMNFSKFSEYIINNDKIIIDGIEIPIKITENTIETKAHKIYYKFFEDYLLLNSEGENKTSYFLRPTSFIKKYAEFQPKKKIDGKIIVYEENKLTDLEFKLKGGFNMYLKNIFDSFKDYSKSENYFVFTFILTEDSKITNIKVKNGISKSFDKMALEALQNSEKYFHNTTGKNYLLTRAFRMKIYDDGLFKSSSITNSDEELYNEDQSSNRKIIQYYNKGIKYYNNNDFENSILEFEKIKNIKNINLKNMQIKNIFLQLGISYLAINKVEKACENFRVSGEFTDFHVRNYLSTFCTK